jgi:hypothetical protein
MQICDQTEKGLPGTNALAYFGVFVGNKNEKCCIKFLPVFLRPRRFQKRTPFVVGWRSARFIQLSMTAGK